MIVMDAGPSRFQLRAAALIRHNDHILVHRAVMELFWSLPGGRVEAQESGAETLEREIREETGCTSRIGRLRFVIENFFTLGGRQMHEVGFYYDADLLTPLPFHETDIVHRSHDGGTELEFRWVRVEQAALDQLDLKPLPLIPLIENTPNTIAHLVYRD